MGSVEDVVDEMLGLLEASSKDPMEEFLSDLVQVSSDNMVEGLLTDLFEVSSKERIAQILNDLLDVTCKYEVLEPLNEIIKISFMNRTEEKSLDASTKDALNQLLTTVEEAKFRDNTASANSEGFSISDDQQPTPTNITRNEKTCSMCSAIEKGVVYRRNDPGTTREEWCNWPYMSFEEMDNTLNVQQYIQQCIHKDPSDVVAILEAPRGQEEGVWKYEHVRQFCMQLNGLALLLQDECKPDVCVQMTATEQWIFLCAAHKNPKECPAIDYTRHTLDGAAALLNSNKYFPSRISIKESSMAKIGSVCRRIYRIFAHAYFHHPELFEKFEIETHLCRRFTVFVKKYNLMANEHLIVPILEQKLNHS